MLSSDRFQWTRFRQVSRSWVSHWEWFRISQISKNLDLSASFAPCSPYQILHYFTVLPQDILIPICTNNVFCFCQILAKASLPRRILSVHFIFRILLDSHHVPKLIRYLPPGEFITTLLIRKYYETDTGKYKTFYTFRKFVAIRYYRSLSL